MLKPYNELRKIDVLPYCEERETKNERGKTVKVPYLNWAKCKDLLHENGAEVVYFEPLVNDNGSTLFMTDIPFTDSKGNHNRCFEVRVKIVIDDLEFIQNYPLLNGMYVVREDTVNQLRLSNAQARAFVKGVAIRTGLGFGLWISNDETTKTENEENLYSHSILKIRERLNQTITKKLDEGKSLDVIAKATGLQEGEDVREIVRYCNKIYSFEELLNKI
ncbi:DUF1071 domain-containing protein [Anaerotruncus sp. 80]|uniref:DUF1071 domain-containing protein n=1 Tax=Anaerotruncus colihominis TaxID=169435 RepID=A0A845QLQ8_9FIRM|nr:MULTISPECIES: DUF1071 domain-containing protein [Anaerotruncus]NBH62739.1 DUF1071 domain-containing protein [Anaerotruncus colihominis]NCF03393.1 DUF1071 domain-containing protein [Anaerotruncus sp. 80]